MLGYQVTLTSANTKYNLRTLVVALDSAFVDQGDFCIQATDDGGTQVFLIGGSDLDSTHYGASMHAGDFSAHFLHLAGIYAQCDTAAKKLNITVGRV